MKKVSILDMAEDLIDADLSSDIDKNQTAGSKKSMPTRSLSLESLITDVAKILEIPVEDLTDWIDESAVPENVLKTILTTAKRLKLNPVLGQITWECNQEGGHEVFIPIDGWIAMIHREPSFQGVAFNQSEEIENGVPIWMECTIFRSDLTYPITIREYYAELKSDHQIWQQKPRRMLRHKTLRQCVRLAFGIITPELNIKYINLQEAKDSLSTKNQQLPNSKALLKQKLSMS